MTDKITPSAISKDIRIGYTYFDQRHMFWILQAQAVNERALQLEADLSLAPAPTSYKQAKALRDLIKQQVDVLIVGPVDGTHPGLVQAVQEALNAGIPVITTNQEIQDTVVTAVVRSDDLKGGQLAAEYLIKQLAGSGEIILIDSPYPILRVEGFRQIIDGHPKCQIVYSQAGDWTRTSGAAITQEALEAHPKAQAIFTVNDTMALGALDTLKEMDRTDSVVVVGYDAEMETFQAIDQGEIKATVVQAPQAMGRIALESAVSVANGKTVPPLILTDVNLVTTNNLVQQLLDTLETFPHILYGLVDSFTARQQLQQETLAVQQETLETQKQLIQELSTPVIPVMDQIIIVPLVGSIDSMRARDITRSLLAGISQHKAKIVILDVTGVPIVDSGVANHLNKAIQAAKLKGANTIITGISDTVAETIVDLGIDWSNVTTLSNLQIGLTAALRSLGVKLTR